MSACYINLRYLPLLNLLYLLYVALTVTLCCSYTSSLTRWASSPVDVDCMSNNPLPLPLSPVACLPSQCVQVLFAPIRDIIRPFSTWSLFPCFALHHTKHYGFQHSCVLHPANVAKELEFSLYYDLNYFSVGSNALLHFLIPDFLLPPDVQNPPVTLHFKSK